MTKHIPAGFSQTSDCFASVLTWSPEFKGQRLSFDQAFLRLQTGIDTVLEKAKNETAIDLLKQCKREIAEAKELFHANTSDDPEKRRAAKRLLTHAYYELFREAGRFIKPGVAVDDIGPDDDV